MTTIHVSNISHNTSETEVSNFFSFCGKITSITLTPASGDADSMLSATITFERDSAAKTAILLDGTPLNNSPLSVTAAHNLDEIAGSHIASSGNIGPDGEIPQEYKPRAAIFAEYLANGYVIGDSALQKGIEIDQKHQLTSTFAVYLNNVFTTIDTTVHASDRAKAADGQYNLSKKAQSATSGLARYFEKALETSPGQRVRQFYRSGEKQVLDIHNEAKRLAEMKIEKKRLSQDIGASADGKPFSEGSLGASESNTKAEAEGKAGPTGQIKHAVHDVKETPQA